MRPGIRIAALLLLVGAHRFVIGQAVQGGPLPGPLPLFPPDNWWNVDVSAAPVDPASAALINWIGAGRGLHPDFGGDASTTTPDIYGFPYIVVPGNEPLELIGAFTYPTESDTGAPGRPAGYPIPIEAKTLPKWIEGGYPGNCDPTSPTPQTSPCRGDRHMLIVDKDNRLVFELYNARCVPYGSLSCSWIAGSGAIFLLDSDVRRPETWTSADAAGLAILPGLIRYDEVYGPDPIKHAFRFTTRDSNGYVYPASHSAGSQAGAPPMGARLRLKASKDISGYTAPVRKVFQAMKTYGLIMADNGSDMYVQGTYDTRWDNGLLNPAFAGLHAGDFEVVQLGWMRGKGDFDGNGTSDIVWRNTTTGDDAVWFMNGTSVIGGGAFGSAPLSWSIVGVGDFNADGKPDIVWRNTSTGDDAIWFMNGTTIIGAAAFGTEPLSWSIVGVGDFNGDGKPDIVWRNTATGDNAIWYMNGTTITGAAALPSAPTSWSIVGVADFNGDGKPDIVWRNTATGDDAIWYMNGTTVIGGGVFGTESLSWSIAAVGDFNGDGKPDIGWRNTATGDDAIWYMNGTSVIGGGAFSSAPLSWSIVGPR